MGVSWLGSLIGRRRASCGVWRDGACCSWVSVKRRMHEVAGDRNLLVDEEALSE